MNAERTGDEDLVTESLLHLAVLGWARLPEPFMWTLRVIVIVGMIVRMVVVVSGHRNAF